MCTVFGKITEDVCSRKESGAVEGVALFHSRYLETLLTDSVSVP